MARILVVDHAPQIRRFLAVNKIVEAGDAALQLKGIAASRYVTVQEVRQLMDEHTKGKDQEPLGHKRINIREVNQALDERWPIK